MRNKDRKFNKKLIGLMICILFFGFVLGLLATSYKCIGMLQQQEEQLKNDK